MVIPGEEDSRDSAEDDPDTTARLQTSLCHRATARYGRTGLDAGAGLAARPRNKNTCLACAPRTTPHTHPPRSTCRGKRRKDSRTARERYGWPLASRLRRTMRVWWSGGVLEVVVWLNQARPGTNSAAPLVWIGLGARKSKETDWIDKLSHWE